MYVCMYVCMPAWICMYACMHAPTRFPQPSSPIQVRKCQHTKTRCPSTRGPPSYNRKTLSPNLTVYISHHETWFLEPHLAHQSRTANPAPVNRSQARLHRCRKDTRMPSNPRRRWSMANSEGATRSVLFTGVAAH